MRITYERTCMFCGNLVVVRGPEGWADLDVDAEFSSQGRSFSDVEDGDPVGVGCHRCARRRWRRAVPATSDHQATPDEPGER